MEDFKLKKDSEKEDPDSELIETSFENSKRDSIDIGEYAREKIEKCHSDIGIVSLPPARKLLSYTDHEAEILEEIEPYLELLNEEISELVDVEPRELNELSEKTIYDEQCSGVLDIISKLYGVQTPIEKTMALGSIRSFLAGNFGGKISDLVDGTLGVIILSGYGITQGLRLNTNFMKDYIHNNIKGTLYFTGLGDCQIGISSEPLTTLDAYRTTASELFHYFQKKEGSTTFDHEYLLEGFQRVFHYQNLLLLSD